MIKIYIDLFFAINYLIDYISLFAVGKILYFTRNGWRFAAASLIGAIYSTIAFFKSPHFMISILLPFILIFLISDTRRVRKIISGAFMFILCEILIGGSVSALRGLTGHLRGGRIQLAITVLLISVVSGAVYYVFQTLVSRRIKTPVVTATLVHNGKKRRLCLLIDSGNMARDFLTGERMIFLSPQSLAGLDIASADEYESEIYTASGKGSVKSFRPSKITFDDKKYNGECFVVASSPALAGLQGYDGIVSLIV